MNNDAVSLETKSGSEDGRKVDRLKMDEVKLKSLWT